MTLADQVFGTNQPQTGKTTADNTFGIGSSVEEKEDDSRIDELIAIAKNGLVNGFEGISDLMTLGGSAVISSATKGVLKLSGQGELASEIPFFDLEELPSQVVKDSLRDMGVDIRTPNKGDLLGNIIDIMTATLPFSAGGAFTSTLKKRALSFIVAEETAAGLAGTARTTAEIVAPDSPGIAAAAEIGTALVTSPTIFALNVGKNITQRVATATSQEGKLRRAATKIQAQADDAAKAADDLEKSKSVLKIEPGRDSGDQGLIALAASEEQINASASLTRQAKLSQQAQDELKSALGGGGGNEQKFIAQLKAKKVAFEKRMEGRLDQVKADIQEAVTGVGEANPARQAASSKNMKVLLDDGYAKEVNLERALWDKVDLKQKVPNVQTLKPLALAVKTIKTTFGDFTDGLPVKQIGQIKSLIRGARKGKLKVNDLKQMRTSIGAQISTELGSQTPNRILLTSLREIDDALLEVMEKSGISDDLANAIAQSRAKNNLFNRGAVGKVRGFDAVGDPKVRPELTLNEIIKAEEKGIVGVSDLFMAVDGPEARSVVGEYMLGLFATEVALRGGINPKTAQNFMRKYSGVLDQVPDVKKQIIEAIDTRVISQKIIQKGEESLKSFSRKGTERRALLTMLDYEDPAEAINSIIKSKTPNKGIKQLVSAAAQDKTGAATAGLKDSLVDSIIDNLTTTQTIQGVKLLSKDNVSGKITSKFMGALENSGLYSKEQIGRLKRVITDMESNATVSQSTVKGGSDTVQKLFGSVLSMGMLRFVVPTLTKNAGGGKLAIASRISAMTQFWAEKIGTQAVKDLVSEAVLENKALLVELLRKPTSVAEAREAILNIDSFMVSTATRAAQEDDQVNQ